MSQHTSPATVVYRRRGIATQCMRGVLAHLRDSRHLSVTLTDDRGVEGFYRRFGFRPVESGTVTRVWERGSAATAKG